MRKAIVKGSERGSESLARVQAFLPSNYTAEQDDETNVIVITGEDVAGWTLDDYVIPRLASGLIFAEEVK